MKTASVKFGICPVCVGAVIAAGTGLAVAGKMLAKRRHSHQQQDTAKDTLDIRHQATRNQPKDGPAERKPE